MTLYQSNYLNHLAVVKDNFPVRPGEAQTIYRKMTVNLLDKYFFKTIKQYLVKVRGSTFAQA